MRRRGQANRLTQIGTFAQELSDFAVIAAHELLEHKDGEELMLRELPGAAPVRVSRQRLDGHRVCDQQHLPRRLGGLVHPASCRRANTLALPNMRRTDDVFYGAGEGQFCAFFFEF